MSKVLLKYWFIFDTDEVLSRQDGFNSDLTSMLKARGLQAERVERVTEDEEQVILYITVDKSNPPEPPQPSKRLQPELKEALEQ